MQVRKLNPFSNNHLNNAGTIDIYPNEDHSYSYENSRLQPNK